MEQGQGHGLPLCNLQYICSLSKIRTLEIIITRTVMVQVSSVMQCALFYVSVLTFLTPVFSSVADPDPDLIQIIRIRIQEAKCTKKGGEQVP